jgi:UDP:flavonoid glycosyltransferase YjiC (YdhE family)
MRILFNCLGDYGHFHPLAVLAKALVIRGHEVRFATEKGFASQIQAGGFDVIEVPGRDPAAGSQEWSRWTEELAGEALAARAPTVLGWFWEGAIRAVPSILEVIEEWQPNVIVREQTAWAGAIAAKLTTLPFATFYFNPRPPGGLAAMIGNEIDRDLQGLGIADGGDFLESDPHLALVGGPAGWFDQNELCRNSRTIRPPLVESRQDETPPWLALLGRNRPLVYVTMGTVFNRDPKLFQSLVDGLASCDVDALITIGKKRPGGVTANQLGDLPDGVRVEEYVDQSLVLPKAAAVIGHGGYGTTMGALTHGLPIVCIPQAALDNHANANRVVRLGAGVIIEDASAEAIAAGVSEVLANTSIASAASRAAASIATLPSADQAGSMIEEISIASR